MPRRRHGTFMFFVPTGFLVQQDPVFIYRSPAEFQSGVVQLLTE